MTPRRKPTPVETAVKREIAEAAMRSPGSEKSAAAAVAVHLARDVEGDDRLAARVTAAKVLLDAVDRIRAIPPADQAADRLDDLAKRRAHRKASAS